MLHLGRKAVRPGVVGKVYDDIRSASNKVPGKVSKNIFKTDRGGEFKAIDVKNRGLLPRFPEVGIRLEQDLV
jgi:hypothetical protein